ncbi:MAG: hypothetical protein VX519_12800 [Myxococcota bacterium]|nr:hypothetical protein [Myxococcota bacterium]
MTFWLLIACTQPLLSNGDCDDLQTAADRDHCRYEQFMVLEPSQIQDALNQAQTFEDPVVRGAAIVGWIQEHSREISQEGGEQLCGILSKTSEQAACKRRFSAAHLQR